MSDGIVRNVRLPGGDMGDIGFRAGRIVSVAQAAGVAIDGSGYVALPRLTDTHLHLDKTLLGGRWYPHRPGRTIAARIDREIELLASAAVEDTYTRACRLVELALRNGTTRIRSHVDISARLGLTRLRALEGVRARYRGAVEISFVAFPQEGILASPGTAELLEEALADGVEAIGGLDPASRDGDMARSLQIVFDLAVRYGRRIDIHLHDPRELGLATMREIALHTLAAGLQRRVCISHGYALSQASDEQVRRTAAALAEAGVTLVTNVPGNGLLPPVATLVAAGVNVVFASDNVRDCWSPYGKADMLERVAMAGYQLGWNEDAELLAGLGRVTTAPSHALGDEAALLRPGDPADLTLVPAQSLPEAIVMQPSGRIVIKGGTVVARDGQALATASRA